QENKTPDLINNNNNKNKNSLLNKLAESYLIQAKHKYDNLLNKIELLHNLNVKYHEAFDLITSIDSECNSIESQLNIECRKLPTLSNNQKEIELVCQKFKKLSHDLELLKPNLKQLKTTEDTIKNLNTNLNSFKSNELNDRLESLETRITNNQQFLQDQLKSKQNDQELFENLQENLNLKNYNPIETSKIIDNLKNNELIHNKDHLENFIVLNECLNTFNLNLNKIEQEFSKKLIDFDLNDLFNNSIKLKQKIKYLKDSKISMEKLNIDLIENKLVPCLNRIKCEFVPSLYTVDNYDNLSNKLQQIKIMYKQKIECLDTNLDLLNNLEISNDKYFKLYNDLKSWCLLVEDKLNEPMGNSFEILENQYEDNEQLIKDFQTKLHNVQELIQLSKQLSKIVLPSNKQQDNKKIDEFTEKYQNGSYFYYQELSNQLNEKLDSIGKRLQDRNKLLLDKLDKIKTHQEDMDNLDERLNEIKSNILKLFDMNENDCSLDEIKIELSMLNQINDNFKILENDFKKLENEFDLIKSLINESNDEKLISHMKKVNFNFESTSKLIKNLNNLIQDNISNLEQFDNYVEILTNSLFVKETKMNEILSNLKEIGEVFNKSTKKISDESFRPLSDKLITINSNYDLILNNLKSSIEFIKSNEALESKAFKLEQKVSNEISQLSKNLHKLDDIFQKDEDCMISDLYSEIDSIDKQGLKSCQNLHESLQSVLTEQNSLINNFYTDLINSSNLNCDQIRFDIENIATQTHNLKTLFSKYLIEENKFNSLNLELNHFINLKIKQLDNEQLNNANDDDNLEEKLQVNKNTIETILKEINSKSTNLQILKDLNFNLEQFTTPAKIIQQNRKLVNNLETKWNDTLSQCDLIKIKIDSSISQLKQLNEIVNKHENLLSEINDSINQDPTNLNNALEKLNNLEIPNGLDGEKLNELKTTKNNLQNLINLKLNIEQIDKNFDHSSDLKSIKNDLDLIMNKIENIECKDTFLLDHIKTLNLKHLEQIDRKLSQAHKLNTIMNKLKDNESKIDNLEIINQSELTNVDLNELENTRKDLDLILKEIKNGDLGDEERASLSLVNEIENKINNLNLKLNNVNDVVSQRSKFLQDLKIKLDKFDSRLSELNLNLNDKVKLFSSSLTKPKELKNLLHNLQEFRNNDLNLFKKDLNELNSSVKESNLTIPELFVQQLDKINSNKIESILDKELVNLEQLIFKSSEYENKVKFLNDCLNVVESGLTEMSLIKYDFSNLNLIDEHLEQLNKLINNLLKASNELDDFKDLCESLIQNCDNKENCDLIEKTMENLIAKWNQLSKQCDEKKTNLNFLNTHLINLDQCYVKMSQFIQNLHKDLSCNLILNCIDPTVMKYQYENMSKLNESLIENIILINDLKHDAKCLLSLDKDFQLNNHNDDDENKYLCYLPKSATQSSLHNLINLLNNDIIMSSIDSLELKINEFKILLDNNLNIMHRLYPLCEKFSLNLSRLNQSISNLDCDLDWLDSTNENETSQKDKKDLYNQIKESIVDNEQLLTNDIQDTISSSIIDEINLSNFQCTDLITDLNENILTSRHRINNLVEKYENSYRNFQIRRQNSKEIYSDMNDILEWLDMIDSKYSDLNVKIKSHEPECIEQELKEQFLFNDELIKQKSKLRQLDLKSQQMIRQKQIDDSIEIKEKLVNLQVQLDNYLEIGSNRGNRLQEALVIAKTFSESYKPLVKWLTNIQYELDQLDSNHKPKITTDSKEFLKNELNILNKIDQELHEKKSDFDLLNKNALNLFKIASFDSEDNQNELKQMLSSINQTFDDLKKFVHLRKNEIENILWKSSELTDKLDNLQCNLKSRDLMSNEEISAHPDKIRQQFEDNKNLFNDLNKRRQDLIDIKDQLIMSSTTSNEAISLDFYEKKLDNLEKLWNDLKTTADVRNKVLNEVMSVSEVFWNEHTYLNDVMNDLDERLKLMESETVALDPDSVFEQQQYHQQIVKDIDENENKFKEFKQSGKDLLKLCSQMDHVDVQKAIEDTEMQWNRIKETVKDHDRDLQMTFSKACEFQQELIEILEWISSQQEKFVNLDSSLNTSSSDDPKTIRFQINLLKEFKEKVDPEQMKILLLNHKFNDLKSNTKTNQSFEVLESLQEPLNSANKEWKRLQSSINERKSNLQNILLDMGQLNEVLEEISKSIDSTLNSIETIDQFLRMEDVPIRTIDAKIARLRTIEKDIKSQDLLLTRLKEKCRNFLKNESVDQQQHNLNDLRKKIQMITENNQIMMNRFDMLKQSYESELSQSQSLVCELMDSIEWLKDIESILNKNTPFGGLPETAREQLDQFNRLNEQIETNRFVIEELIHTASERYEQSLLENNTDNILKENLENLCKKWSCVLKKSSDKQEKLNNALNIACEFNDKFHRFVKWLNETEKYLNQMRPFSKILNILDEQIKEHQHLQANITQHRDDMIDLDKIGNHLKYYSQRQDAILIKNLLISIQNRWEKIVGKSSNRTRDLERGYQEAKMFYDEWKDLLEWLDHNSNYLAQENTIGNNPHKIKQQINKHADFHRVLNTKQSSYEKTQRIGRRLLEKCDQDSQDRVLVQEMMSELKNKWKHLCVQSVERQKKLEEALLCSGQFRDALLNLIDWLSKVEPTLSENTSLYADLDNVLALIEDNQQFQKQLQLKAEQVYLINKAANDIIRPPQSMDNDQEVSHLNDKLKEMNNLWQQVDALSKDRTNRLDTALKLAKEFQAQVRSCIEWLNNAEQMLKSDWKKCCSHDNENEIRANIDEHQMFIRNLNEQKVHIDQCLELGAHLLSNCIPEAVITLKHCVVLVQSRWDEVNKLSDEKLSNLIEALDNFKENENLLNELLIWLQGAEATLTALEQKPIVNNLELVEQLLRDQLDFQNELQMRQSKVDKFVKNGSSKEFESILESSKRKNSKFNNTPSSSSNIKNRYEWKAPEPKLKNPRIKLMFERWRKVWLLSLDRQRKLKELLERLKEMEKLRDFSFDEWRQRFMAWHKDNRARITDFFRRQDKDHDGKISREEFIQGILNTNFPSSRLELEAVADIFDHDKDGFIDYKEFLATLKPNISNQPNFERIRDEVHRQVSLCKCSKQYHVLQISERHFRFGDSQKLRLVRILQSTVMVRVGGGWMALDEFLVKNDPCRGRDIFKEFIKVINQNESYLAKGRLNFDLRDQFMHRDGSINRSKSPGKLSSTPSQSNNLKGRSSLGMSSKKSQGYSVGDGQNDGFLNTPVLSGKNSHSNSLGASISDLSLDALSENSENLERLSNRSKNQLSSGGSNTPQKQSRIPVPKKN
ncbi:unnamed protein product, partial [Brachionus calyciflorus]